MKIFFTSPIDRTRTLLPCSWTAYSLHHTAKIATKFSLTCDLDTLLYHDLRFLISSILAIAPAWKLFTTDITITWSLHSQSSSYPPVSYCEFSNSEAIRKDHDSFYVPNPLIVRSTSVFSQLNADESSRPAASCPTTTEYRASLLYPGMPIYLSVSLYLCLSVSLSLCHSLPATKSFSA